MRTLSMTIKLLVGLSVLSLRASLYADNSPINKQQSINNKQFSVFDAKTKGSGKGKPNARRVTQKQDNGSSRSSKKTWF